MILLDMLFIVICAYMFCGWQVAEKHFRQDESRKTMFFMYYCWPLFLLKQIKHSHRAVVAH